jgi:hypothetical protein
LGRGKSGWHVLAVHLPMEPMSGRIVDVSFTRRKQERVARLPAKRQKMDGKASPKIRSRILRTSQNMYIKSPIQNRVSMIVVLFVHAQRTSSSEGMYVGAAMRWMAET